MYKFTYTILTLLIITLVHFYWRTILYTALFHYVIYNTYVC